MTWQPALDRRDHPAAVTVAGRVLSTSALYAAAAALAGRIGGAPVVAVYATPTVETVVAVLAGLTAGVPVVPVPPDAGPRELDHILTDSHAPLLLTNEEVATDVTTMPIDVTARAASRPAPADPDGTALILYTSGTTGAPKGVALSHAAIAADLDALTEAWQWTPDDRLVHGLPLYHVHGLILGVLGALRVGCPLVHTGRPTPTAYAAAQGSLYFGVPTVWSRVAADPAAARALRTARLLVSGSAPLPARTFAALNALTGHRPAERYGMTETLITVSARADGERRPGTVGTPLSGVETRLADAELQVRGPTLFSSYVHQPAATAAAYTADGWFRTGDAATIDAAGVHRIVGRLATDLIKSGGFRVGAGEVEEALLAHPAVHEAAVVGAPHDDLGQEIVAYVVADGATEADLCGFVATSLSRHKRPRRVVFLDALPRNAMGKIQKHLLGTR
jgi:fatty acid CoA ligase FadD36